ncbi:anaerobic dehydrogenase, typically selenocysteine-containing [Desulfocapsa sulfexigens DSM 10523]|uniref:Anaerobic dehydrogenase, typically selenocysteine-containing n=1 Tax=Desulfocapsa sulfexigens (strain DSM 10523 / SB164P1) TaxID=1167006 RepID=M1P6T7_DESSD|nr:molybdopterin-dependent oxidoreductase [Desulfocapsa sulfexigens]AGF79178.1 anaerobic dehydrogenase, typically selenocysteine-containing [Desulfocapsa sulfexigens DSM 10523]
MKKSVYSMCGMCTVRCPIRVESENNKVTWIEGNQHILGGALCAKGSAGPALVADRERPQQPLIREGARGEGRWQKVSWPTALDYISNKLKKIKTEYGPESVVLSSRGGPWQNMYKTFIHAFGSPNYTNHDCTCGRNTHHASLSINGVGRKGFIYDIKNAKHLILFGRNMFASLRIGENLQTMDMLENGGKLTYVDVRQTMTGIKADRFFQVRPGTDYALILAMIHELIRRDAYDADFVERYVSGFDELTYFVEQYTPDWAAKECGIKAKAIHAFIDEIIPAMPKVIFHPGWNLSRYKDSFYASRGLHILNVLMGNIEQKGGLLIPKGPGDCGVKGLRALDCPKPDIKRADGVGWKYKHFDKGPGLAHLFFDAMEKEDPYPVKAWIAMRHDPFSGMPDPQRQKMSFEHCDLLVSIDTHYSEFGWFSDVILPESTYLERESTICVQKSLKPRLAIRKRAVEPEFDTKPGWWIFKQLAERVDIGEYFPYNSAEELWSWQLEPTGFTIADFDAKGFVPLTDEPIMYDPLKLEGQFNTPSGKIEIISKKLEDAGLPSLKEYQSPIKPPKGMFRLVYGRSAVHSHGHTTNNPLLSELMPENSLWINTRAADKLGIANGDLVNVSSEDESYSGPMHAHVVDYIHPEAVYMVHGFGKQIPLQTRSYHAGISDQKLMIGKLDDWDQAGGAINLCESFVLVRRSVRNPKRRVEL